MPALFWPPPPWTYCPIRPRVLRRRVCCRRCTRISCNCGLRATAAPPPLFALPAPWPCLRLLHLPCFHARLFPSSPLLFWEGWGPVLHTGVFSTPCLDFSVLRYALLIVAVLQSLPTFPIPLVFQIDFASHVCANTLICFQVSALPLRRCSGSIM